MKATIDRFEGDVAVLITEAGTMHLLRGRLAPDAREGDVIDLAAAQNILTKCGTWYNYGETRVGQGRDRARQFLEENPKITAELCAKVREAYVSNGKIPASVGAAGSEGETEE